MTSKSKTKTATPKASAQKTGETSTDRRLAALENAVRILATAQFAPNGGGPEHVEEARALSESLGV